VLKPLIGEGTLASEKLLEFLRSFAPGLAMRHLARPKELGPTGLLGLLLTAQSCLDGSNPSAVIPLDEHPWLYGRSGTRADVLLLLLNGNKLELTVAESKWSEGLPGREREKAREQVRATSGALSAWSALKPMALTLRRHLADALQPRMFDSHYGEA